jgi:GT2 family glycosyltransferase/SAM-dependent methyltransferase
MTRCSLVVPLRLSSAVTPPDPDAAIAEILFVGGTDERVALSEAVATASGTTAVRWLPAPAQSGSGFAAACNAGAAAAAHPYVIFLVPEVQPHPGWLAPLLDLVERDPRVAVAGSMLLSSPDTIYHAGIIVDQECWPRRIYAGFPAGHPAVNRTRRMQMVSGACMLVRRDAFEAMGGFDTAFAAEDAGFDLCLRLGQSGREVYYCHDSVAACPADGPHRDESPESLSRSRRLFRTRWIHKLRPDDVSYYAADRLLQVRYEEGAAACVIVSPPLATALPDPRANATEQVLAARGHQVRALLEQNTRLMERITGLEAESRRRAASGAVAVATMLEPPLSSLAALAPVPTPSHLTAGDDLLPSPELALSVGGAFRETGEEFLPYFIEIGGLRPTDRVLDIGCGVGRMAVPLTGYLTGDGRYDGFDVMANAIDWCQRHITPRYPSFRFEHAALRNRAYNSSATTAPTAYEFPYPPASFDFVFLTSVFTHMLPDEVRHYLAEIARVLRPGGRCFSTFFLLNAESEGLMRAGLSPHFPFAHRHDGYRVQDVDVPEAAVAYDEPLMRQWYHTAGLVIADPIRYGYWCGRLDGLSLQDIVLATKS